MGLRVSKNKKKIGVRTRYLGLANGGDARTFALVKVLTSLQENLRLKDNFITELNIVLSEINFRRKIITFCYVLVDGGLMDSELKVSVGVLQGH